MWLYRVMRVLVSIVLVPFLPLKKEGMENIPASGKIILVGNHINMLDPLLMTATTKRFLRFMAKHELFEKPWIAWAATNIGAFPINRGTADLSGIKTALSILKNEGALLIFPEGTRNRNKRGPMLPLHEGVALLALKAGAPIIPFFIEGKYHLFGKVHIRIGRPIELSDLCSARVDKQAMQECMSRVRSAIHAMGEIVE